MPPPDAFSQSAGAVDPLYIDRYQPQQLPELPPPPAGLEAFGGQQPVDLYQQPQYPQYPQQEQTFEPQRSSYADLPEGNLVTSGLAYGANAAIAGTLDYLTLSSDDRGVRDSIGRLRDIFQERADKNLKNKAVQEAFSVPFSKNIAGQTLFNVASATPLFGTAYGVSMLTAGLGAPTAAAAVLGASTFFPSSYSSFYREAVAGGMQEKQASNFATLAGLGEVGLEIFPFMGFFKGGSALRQVARGFVREGLIEEGTQQLWSNTLQVIGYKGYDNLAKDLTEGMAASMLAGGIMGGGFGGVSFLGQKAGYIPVSQEDVKADADAAIKQAKTRARRDAVKDGLSEEQIRQTEERIDAMAPELIKKVSRKEFFDRAHEVLQDDLAQRHGLIEITGGRHTFDRINLIGMFDDETRLLGQEVTRKLIEDRNLDYTGMNKTLKDLLQVSVMEDISEGILGNQLEVDSNIYLDELLHERMVYVQGIGKKEAGKGEGDVKEVSAEMIVYSPVHGETTIGDLADNLKNVQKDGLRNFSITPDEIQVLFAVPAKPSLQKLGPSGITAAVKEALTKSYRKSKKIEVKNFEPTPQTKAKLQEIADMFKIDEKTTREEIQRRLNEFFDSGPVDLGIVPREPTIEQVVEEMSQAIGMTPEQKMAQVAGWVENYIAKFPANVQEAIRQRILVNYDYNVDTIHPDIFTNKLLKKNDITEPAANLYVQREHWTKDQMKNTNRESFILDVRSKMMSRINNINDMAPQHGLEELVQPWLDYFDQEMAVDSGNLQKALFNYFIMDAVDADFNADSLVRTPSVAVFNSQILSKAYNAYLDNPGSGQIYKTYRTLLVDTFSKSKQFNIGEDLAQWETIPRNPEVTMNSPEVARLRSLACNTWCVFRSIDHAQSYIQNGTFHILIVNGRPRVGIADKGGSLEIQNLHNDGVASVDYIDETVKFLEDQGHRDVRSIRSIQLAQNFKQKGLTDSTYRGWQDPDRERTRYDNRRRFAIDQADHKLRSFGHRLLLAKMGANEDQARSDFVNVRLLEDYTAQELARFEPGWVFPPTWHIRAGHEPVPDGQTPIAAARGTGLIYAPTESFIGQATEHSVMLENLTYYAGNKVSIQAGLDGRYYEKERQGQAEQLLQDYQYLADDLVQELLGKVDFWDGVKQEVERSRRQAKIFTAVKSLIQRYFRKDMLAYFHINPTATQDEFFAEKNQHLKEILEKVVDTDLMTIPKEPTYHGLNDQFLKSKTQVDRIVYAARRQSLMYNDLYIRGIKKLYDRPKRLSYHTDAVYEETLKTWRASKKTREEAIQKEKDKIEQEAIEAQEKERGRWTLSDIQEPLVYDIERWLYKRVPSIRVKLPGFMSPPKFVPWQEKPENLRRYRGLLRRYNERQFEEQQRREAAVGRRPRFQAAQQILGIPDQEPYFNILNDTVMGYYDVSTDKVTLVAKNIETEESARRQVVHELSHRGMVETAKSVGGFDQLYEILKGAESELMKAAPDMIAASGYGSLEEFALDYNFDLDTPEGNVGLLMELAAKWSERFATEEPTSWWVKMINDLKIWFKRFMNVDLTEEEVDFLVAGFVTVGASNNTEPEASQVMQEANAEIESRPVKELLPPEVAVPPLEDLRAYTREEKVKKVVNDPFKPDLILTESEYTEHLRILNKFIEANPDREDAVEKFNKLLEDFNALYPETSVDEMQAAVYGRDQRFDTESIDTDYIQDDTTDPFGLEIVYTDENKQAVASYLERLYEFTAVMQSMVTAPEFGFTAPGETISVDKVMELVRSGQLPETVAGTLFGREPHQQRIFALEGQSETIEDAKRRVLRQSETSIKQVVTETKEQLRDIQRVTPNSSAIIEKMIQRMVKLRSFSPEKLMKNYVIKLRMMGIHDDIELLLKSAQKRLEFIGRSVTMDDFMTAFHQEMDSLLNTLPEKLRQKIKGMSSDDISDWLRTEDFVDESEKQMLKDANKEAADGGHPVIMNFEHPVAVMDIKGKMYILKGKYKIIGNPERGTALFKDGEEITLSHREIARKITQGAKEELSGISDVISFTYPANKFYSKRKIDFGGNKADPTVPLQAAIHDKMVVKEGVYTDHEINPEQPRQFTMKKFLSYHSITNNISFIKENIRKSLFPNEPPEPKQKLIDDQIVTYLYADKRYRRYAQEIARINMRPSYEVFLSVAQDMTMMKLGKPNKKDTQKNLAAISHAAFHAGAEIFSRQGFPRLFSVTENGNQHKHEKSVDPDKPDQEAEAYVRDMMLIHRSFNFPFTNVGEVPQGQSDVERWTVERDRLSFFTLLGRMHRGRELQSAVVYNKAELETPLLEKAIDVGLFKGADMWKNIDRGFQHRVFDKLGEQKAVSHGRPFLALESPDISPAKYRTTNEFVLASKNKGLNPIADYFASMLEYLTDYETYVSQQTSIQAMLGLLANNQTVIPGFEDNDDVNKLIASAKMVEYRNSPVIAGISKITGMEADGVLQALDYADDPTSPGFALWEAGTFKKPYLYGPFKRAKEQIFSKPPSNDALAKANQVITFFKKYVTVNPFDAAALFMTPVFLNYSFTELAYLPVGFAKAVLKTPAYAKALFKGESMPTMEDEIETYPNWDLFVKHGFTAYNYTSSMESLWDKAQTVDYREQQTHGENILELINSVGGLNTAVFGNYVSHNLYNVVDKFYNKFLDQGIDPDTAARRAVKLVNDTSFMLNPDIFGKEGRILVTTFFTRNLTVGFLRLIAGAVYPFLPKDVYKVKSKGFRSLTNSITHGDTSMQDMEFLARYYKIHVLKTLAAGMLFTSLAQFALSFLDDDERDEHGDVADGEFFSRKRFTQFNEAGKRSVIRTPITDLHGRRVYWSPQIFRESLHIQQILSDWGSKSVPQAFSSWFRNRLSLATVPVFLLFNRDYFGKEIYDPDLSLDLQTQQVKSFLAEQGTPIGFRKEDRVTTGDPVVDVPLLVAELFGLNRRTGVPTDIFTTVEEINRLKDDAAVTEFLKSADLTLADREALRELAARFPDLYAGRVRAELMKRRFPGRQELRRLRGSARRAKLYRGEEKVVSNEVEDLLNQ